MVMAITANSEVSSEQCCLTPWWLLFQKAAWVAWEVITPRPLVRAQLLHMASHPQLTRDLLGNPDQTGADGRPGSRISGQPGANWTTLLKREAMVSTLCVYIHIYFFSWQHVLRAEFLVYSVGNKPSYLHRGT